MGKKSRRQRGRAKETSNTEPSSTVGETQDKGKTVWSPPDGAARSTSNRTEANRLRSRLEVLLKLPDHWHEQRLLGFLAFLEAIKPFAMFRQFSSPDSALWEDDIKKDMNLLKRIRRSSQEPVFYRAWAYVAMARYKFRLKDPYGDSLKWLDSAFDMFNSASDEERSLRVRIGENFVSGDYDKMRDKIFGLVREISESSFIGRLAQNYDGSEPELEVVQVSNFAGWTCDYCQKPRDDVRGGELLTCSKCYLVYYCSRACQKKDWDIRGHKYQCRAKGQFREGDVVALTTDVDNIRPQERGFSTHQLVVLGPPHAGGAEATPATATRWLVHDKENPSQKGIVEERHLKRVRSPLWNELGEQDLEEIRKQLKDLEGDETHVDSNDEEILPDLVRSNTILEDIESDDDGCDGEEVEKQLETETS